MLSGQACVTMDWGCAALLPGLGQASAWPSPRSGALAAAYTREAKGRRDSVRLGPRGSTYELYSVKLTLVQPRIPYQIKCPCR